MYRYIEYRQSAAFTSLAPDQCTTGDWATSFFSKDDEAVAEFVHAGKWPPAIGTKERAKLVGLLNKVNPVVTLS